MTQYWYDCDGEGGSWTPQGWTVQHQVVNDNVTGYGYGKAQTGLVELGVTMGMQHPGYTDSYLQSVSWQALASNIVRYTLNFEPMTNVPDQYTIEGGLESVETNKDKNDTPTYVEYQYPDDYKYDPAKQGAIEKVVKTISKDVPTLRLTVVRREITTKEDIQRNHDTYGGTVNNANWNMFPSALIDTWRCDGVSGVKVGIVWDAVNGERDVYDVTYSFTFRKDKWKTSLAFTDPNTGEVPPSETWGPHTVEDYYMYPQTQFSDLTTWAAEEE